jgi:hypothetical protein
MKLVSGMAKVGGTLEVQNSAGACFSAVPSAETLAPLVISQRLDGIG